MAHLFAWHSNIQLNKSFKYCTIMPQRSFIPSNMYKFKFNMELNQLKSISSDLSINHKH